MANEVVTRIRAKDDTKAGLRSAKSSFQTFAVQAKTITTGIIGAELISAGGRAAMDAARQFFREGIAFTRALETTGAQMRTLLGSQGMAQQQLDFIKRFAADTPFFIQQVADANRLLVQFTGSAVEANDAMNLVGDAAAGSGADVANVALWWGRLVDGLKNNRPVGEALSRLQELGIVNGFVRGRVEELVDAEKGLEAQQFITAEVTETFDGAMERLRDTLGGAIDTAQNTTQDLASLTLEVSGVTEALKDGAEWWVRWGNNAIEWLNRVQERREEGERRTARLIENLTPEQQVLVNAYSGVEVGPDGLTGAQRARNRRLARQAETGVYGPGLNYGSEQAGTWNIVGGAIPGADRANGTPDDPVSVEVVGVKAPTLRTFPLFNPFQVGDPSDAINLDAILGGPTLADYDAHLAGTAARGRAARQIRDVMGGPGMGMGGPFGTTPPVPWEDITTAGDEQAHKDALTANQIAMGILSGVSTIGSLIRSGAGAQSIIGAGISSVAGFLPAPFNWIAQGVGTLLGLTAGGPEEEASRRSFNPQGDRCESFVVTSPGPNTLRINHGQNTYNVVVSMDPDRLDRRIGDALSAA